ncbi:hypothetical protein, partial [Pseudoflavonifractor sp. 524-17]|uniref:hypothetical protein n=1 Tax=Pseudoflavonifractor sp. 524-17 TaxID=2304577 RepID=UPI001A9BFB20
MGFKIELLNSEQNPNFKRRFWRRGGLERLRAALQIRHEGRFILPGRGIWAAEVGSCAEGAFYLDK